METNNTPTNQGITQNNNTPTNQGLTQMNNVPTNQGLTQINDNRLFVDFFPTTEPGVDLKFLLRTPHRLAMGEMVSGAITRDDDDHFTFFESAIDKKMGAVKRNPCIMPGTYINVHRKDDGTLYPTFNRPAYTKTFTFRDFCREAAYELMMVAGSYGKNRLVEEGKGE